MIGIQCHGKNFGARLGMGWIPIIGAHLLRLATQETESEQRQKRTRQGCTNHYLANVIAVAAAGRKPKFK